MKHREKGDTFKIDVPLNAADPGDYDALLLPGGVANPDELRTNSQAVSFVRAIFDSGKPVSAICHGPWMLVEADVVRGRMMTSWPSLKTDIQNAGGDLDGPRGRPGWSIDYQPQARVIFLHSFARRWLRSLRLRRIRL